MKAGSPSELDVTTTEARSPLLRKASVTEVVVAMIAWHPELARVGEEALLEGLDRVGVEVAMSRAEPSFAQPGSDVRQPIGYRAVSRTPIQLSRTRQGLRVVSGAATVGVDGEEVTGETTVPWEDLTRGVVLELAHAVSVLLFERRQSQDAREGMELREGGGVGGPRSLGIIGASVPTRQLVDRIGRVADLDIPVLIRGETGSGKELVAQALHRGSARCAGPFVDVSMAAVPRETAIATLFGHTRGAFTGAVGASPGYFGAADRGTLFLDEIGETSREVQAMLLRALETSTVQRLGTVERTRVDVRLVAATDADLEDAIATGDFLGPLYHRLAHAVIRVPPLRERRPDIPRLLAHFVAMSLNGLGLGAIACADEAWMPLSLVRRAIAAAWPGNVRQLRHFAAGIAIAHRGGGAFEIDPETEEILDDADKERGDRAAERAGDGRNERRAAAGAAGLSDAELKRTMESYGWQVRAAGKALGMAPNSLYRRLESAGLGGHRQTMSAEVVATVVERHGGNLEAAANELQVSVRALQRRLGALRRGES